jgi:acyl-CoA dehydrogenase
MLWLLLLIIIIGVAGYLRLGLLQSTWMVGAWLVISMFAGGISGWMWLIWIPLLLVISVINIPELRKSLVSKPAMGLLKANLPQISRTEQEALDGGNVWWDAELFSGKPDWQRLRDLSMSTLTAEEPAFIKGPVIKRCGIREAWQMSHKLQHLRPVSWDIINKDRY